AAASPFLGGRIRGGVIGGRLAALRRSLRQGPLLQRRRLRARVAFAAGAVVVTTVVLGIGLAVAQPAPRPPGFPAKPANIAITSTTSPLKASNATQAPKATTPAPSAPNTTLVPIPNARVTAVGDSVMLGGPTTLRRFIGDRLLVDANASPHRREGLRRRPKVHPARQHATQAI